MIELMLLLVVLALVAPALTRTGLWLVWRTFVRLSQLAILLVAGALLWLVWAPEAEAGERFEWERAVVVPSYSLAIEYHTVSRYELLAYVRKTDGRAHRRTRGHATLYRRADGTFRCEVRHLREASREVLEHERRHCRGWIHN